MVGGGVATGGGGVGYVQVKRRATCAAASDREGDL